MSADIKSLFWKNLLNKYIFFWDFYSKISDIRYVTFRCSIPNKLRKFLTSIFAFELLSFMHKRMLISRTLDWNYCTLHKLCMHKLSSRLNFMPKIAVLALTSEFNRHSWWRNDVVTALQSTQCEHHQIYYIVVVLWRWRLKQVDYSSTVDYYLYLFYSYLPTTSL